MYESFRKIHEEQVKQKEKLEAIETGTEEIRKKPIINISPDLYKAMKQKEISQEKRIHLLETKITVLDSIINDQNDVINRMERIIDALL